MVCTLHYVNLRKLYITTMKIRLSLFLCVCLSLCGCAWRWMVSWITQKCHSTIAFRKLHLKIYALLMIYRRINIRCCDVLYVHPYQNRISGLNVENHFDFLLSRQTWHLFGPLLGPSFSAVACSPKSDKLNLLPMNSLQYYIVHKTHAHRSACTRFKTSTMHLYKCEMA